MHKNIAPDECYTVPVGRLFLRPYKRATIDLRTGTVALRNLRSGLNRLSVPEAGPERDWYRLTYAAVRDGSGMTGWPQAAMKVRHGGADISIVHPERDELNRLTSESPRELWLAFSDVSTDTARGVAMARFLGVEVNTEYPGSRFQPIVETRAGEPAMVPNTYEQGWLHVRED